VSLKHIIKVLSIVLLISSAFISCKDKKCIKAPDVSGVDITVNIERLDKILYKIPTKNDLEKILIDNPAFADQFLLLSDYPMPGVLVDRYFNLLNAENIDSLFYEVDKAFGDLEDIRLQFEDAFKYLKYYYPDFNVPKIKTVVTGIANDLYISDSLIIIGLDFYLGPRGKYQPKDIPGYLLKRYQKDYLVPQIILLYTNFYNKTDYSDKTAVADMVYYGKAYHMAKNLMPCTPDSLFTGYSAFETKDIVKHEAVIWAGLLENQLLFETNTFMKDKFLSERPKTFELGENCPGRIGRWVGWRIIQKFTAQYPDITLPELMAMDDAQKLFNDSKYKPIKY
jgi:gliding motility-associated lipoprotein GldB